METRIKLDSGIQLGDRVRDRVSGLSGIVVAATVWMYGCARLTVQPDGLHEGKRLDYDTFDELQLDVVEPAAVGY